MEKKFNKFKKSNFKKEKTEVKKPEKHCPFCNKFMKFRGPKNSTGTIYWKCRNKKCGRTINLRVDPPLEIVPLVYVRKY